MKKNFIASVEDNATGDIEQIAGQLRQQGCTIKQVLKFSGIITGCSSGKEGRLEDLKISGIKHIEEDRELGALGEE
ncbi:hypothetical protein [Cyclobacterium marinum]|uniref:Uncharacterized protein n=1 Tax=Cyclobacterium marinum (strain ATCC 25205 / DSM 745 / LMG 13164 / NCIMB 1802) TaxID=880070 RepID=G0J2P2_CYCMS|nr:hypothetical protein [Cyclobacterium marinum]AEL26625.1 hypothetical protein Cycma_2889 [Cyclobacterium marinum DSM 745]MBI0399955.1 hypothetical protein [Cyclobacterium marinum]MBR9774853.1 hypothetical protein [Cytophagales bacterium]|tara:strand:+ start:11691 stop:11918 length:228 start_codon:yes stop_codon:yes gene_type:complete